MQQAGANKLGFTAKKTMAVAQQLYEGIDLGSMGSLGLITYMRTDSTHLSDEAIKEVRHYINNRIGPDYLPAKPKVYASKKAAQQAHEAIRPTDVDLTPADLKPVLTSDQFKLYDIIWRRFVACQMEPARWNVTNLNIVAQTSVGQCSYKSAGRVLVFDGFTKIWTNSSNEQQLPPMETGQKVEAVIRTIDRKNRRISLSIKHTKEDPFTHFTESHSEGEKITGKVSDILPKGIRLMLEGGIEEFIPANYLERRGKKPKDMYELGEEIDVTIRKINPRLRRIILSEKEQYKAPPKKKEPPKPTDKFTIGDILGSQKKIKKEE